MFAYRTIQFNKNVRVCLQTVMSCCIHTFTELYEADSHTQLQAECLSDYACVCLIVSRSCFFFFFGSHNSPEKERNLSEDLLNKMNININL